MNKGPEHNNPQGGDLDAGTEALEAALRQALAPQSPPAGFTDRVMARALAGERPAPLAPAPLYPAAAAIAGAAGGKVLSWPVRRLWIRGAIAAALLLALLQGGTTYKHLRDQQHRIAEATAQFQTTERVTVHALAQAREQLQRAGVPLDLD